MSFEFYTTFSPQDPCSMAHSSGQCVIYLTYMLGAAQTNLIICEDELHGILISFVCFFPGETVTTAV